MEYQTLASVVGAGQPTSASSSSESAPVVSIESVNGNAEGSMTTDPAKRSLSGGSAGAGSVGALALGSLLNPLWSRGQVRKVKNVIHIHLVGAPSHLDLFDYKPELKKYDRQLLPEHLLKGQRFAFLRGHPKLMASPYQFKKCGQSGLELSELLPHLQTVADELTLFKSVHTEQFNHGPAQLLFHTGFPRFGRPSMGSWVSYGLGTARRPQGESHTCTSKISTLIWRRRSGEGTSPTRRPSNEACSDPWATAPPESSGR